MEEENVQAELLLSVQNTEIYSIVGDQKRLFTTGELRLYRLSDQNLYLLTVGDFRYSLSKEIPVMKGDKRSYVFPSTEGFYGIIFPIEVDIEELDVFEIILQDSTEFTKIKDRRNSMPEESTSDTEVQVYIEESQEIVEKEKKEGKVGKISHYIELGGTKIKKGLIRGATFTSKGIVKGGEYLKKKIKKKPKPTEVSEKSKARIRKMKMASQMVLALSKALVSGAVEMTTQIASSISSHFKNSKTGNRLERSKTYQSAKELGMAGINAVVTIYDGLEEAVIILAKSSANTTVSVVEHRYGEQAASATSESLSVLGNVGSAYNQVKKMGLKKLAKATAKKTAIGIMEEEEEKKE
ncbi:unnamed protein product [Blepharisma stoltei]|uniref:Senescence domain-containing protein n=1 Tax=Blepharisma stoltei TaxID=1481888 RepID=A0AAU9IG50_9CILI|nr:unnamed protein product [Blepharisma stoltei]